VLFCEEREAVLNHFTVEHPPLEKNISKWRWFTPFPGGTVNDEVNNTRQVGFIRLATGTGIVNLNSNEKE
jgi:predicted transcriptional regulator